MADVSTIPQTYNITHYGGDTLTIKVTPAAGVADGLVWNSQVRSVRTADLVDATFVITQPATPGDPGYLVLPAAEVSRLVGSGAVVQSRGPDGSLRSVAQYNGEWDCQASNAGLDPVVTFVQGKLIIEIDVTRLP